MATRLYFHATTNDQSGTYPTGEQSGAIPTYTATGATTLRKMDTTIGASQTSHAATSSAVTTQQRGFMGFWTSPPIATGGWTYTNGEQIIFNWANAESNTNANISQNLRLVVYVWRPSTGAVVGTILDTDRNGAAQEPTSASSEQVMHYVETVATTVSASESDVVIVELWTNHSQGMASAYTITYYYDGTTENTTAQAVVSSHASFIEFQNSITFQAPFVKPPGTSLIIKHAPTHAAFW